MNRQILNWRSISTKLSGYPLSGGAAVVVSVAAAITALRFSELLVGSTTDDAVYAEIARSIAEGLGPIVRTGVAGGSPHPVFPVGYPLVLSPVALIFPN